MAFVIGKDDITDVADLQPEYVPYYIETLCVEFTHCKSFPNLMWTFYVQDVPIDIVLITLRPRYCNEGSTYMYIWVT